MIPNLFAVPVSLVWVNLDLKNMLYGDALRIHRQSWILRYIVHNTYYMHVSTIWCSENTCTINCHQNTLGGLLREKNKNKLMVQKSCNPPPGWLHAFHVYLKNLNKVWRQLKVQEEHTKSLYFTSKLFHEVPNQKLTHIFCNNTSPTFLKHKCGTKWKLGHIILSLVFSYLWWISTS